MSVAGCELGCGDGIALGVELGLGVSEASLGKIPTTRDRRLISLLMRSRGLVDQIFCRCARGNAAKASTSGLASAISAAALGKGPLPLERLASSSTVVGATRLRRPREPRRHLR